MGKPFPKTLLVLPVHNHAGTLRSVTRKALAEGFPVLVVDDGSTDGGLHTWLPGALVIGPLPGFAGASLTYVVVRSLRANRPPDARPAGS
jgi:hypothetical protein